MSAEHPRETEVAVVGLGAAGSVAARRLAEAGLEVVALEAGARLQAHDFPLDELENDFRNRHGAKANAEVPTWRPTADVEATTGRRGRIVSLMVNGVGGGTIHYAGQHFRLTPWHLRLRTEAERRYGAGALPAGCAATDWPLSYEELEPYYELVEREIGVAGKAGNVGGALHEGGNVLEAPRRSEFPLPPLRRSGWNDLVAGAARRSGMHPFPSPAAIDPGRCTYCGFCNFNGCHADAKGSTFLNVVPAAERKGVRIVTGARALEIACGPDGRATGVVYLRDGRRHLQPARAVFLSAHALENTRLLLLSRSAAHPDGAGNDHGQVGRSAMTHLYVGVDGLFPGRDLARFNGSYAQATSFDDLNGDNFDHTGLGFVGGGCVSGPQEQKPIATALTTPPSVPHWGGAWADWLSRNGRSIGRLIATAESLPYEDSFLDLDPHVRDPAGVPVVRITYRLHEQEERRYDYLRERLGELLLEAGASETWASFPKLPAAPFQSLFGATRMGDDAATSVADRWCLAHDTPNLALSGSGCFPTSSGYNPTATIQALAWRTADRLVDRWESITG